MTSDLVYMPSGRVVIVCGGRDFTDRDAVFRALDHADENDALALVIQGGARGADFLAKQWAIIERGIHCAEIVPLWSRWGRRAGPMRNAAMLSLCPSLVIAFPGGTGTAHMVALAEANDVSVWRPYP